MNLVTHGAVPLLALLLLNTRVYLQVGGGTCPRDHTCHVSAAHAQQTRGHGGGPAPARADQGGQAGQGQLPHRHRSD